MSEQKNDRQSARELMMLTEPIEKIVPKMALPTIVAFLITSIYSLADTYFVSSLGTNATAAVSVNTSLDQIIMMGGSMLAVGANSYVARLLGAREKKRANRVLSTAFFTAMLFGVLILIFGKIFMKPMVRLLGASPTCEEYSIQYATYVLLAAPFMAGNFVLNQCLRAEGSAMLSMFGMGFGGVLNCFLDPIFIFGLNLGVAGASIATAISKVVSFGILIFPYVTGRSLLRISPGCVKPDRKMLGEIVSVGSSSLFRNALSVLAGIVLNNIASGISDSVLAGIGVSTKIMMFPFGFILGFGSGFQPVAGFNWGARRYDRVRECYRFSSRLAIIGTVAMGLLLGIFANPVIRLFTVSDPQMMQIGALCIRLQCLVLPVHGWVAVVNMFCAGLGRARYAIILATSRQGTCFFPIIFPLAWLAGANGVAAVQAGADFLTFFLAFPIIRRVLRMVDEAEAGAQKIAENGEHGIEVSRNGG